MVVPDVRSDPIVSFDLEKVEFISRPASVIYTIDSSLMEDWKNAVINLQGGPTITPAYIENGVQARYLKTFLSWSIEDIFRRICLGNQCYIMANKKM